MDEWCYHLDGDIQKVTEQFGIKNLTIVQNRSDDDDYWPRLARFSFFNKLFEGHHYHFLYEIQGLSSQIHFGLASCFLLKDNIYNLVNLIADLEQIIAKLKA